MDIICTAVIFSQVLKNILGFWLQCWEIVEQRTNKKCNLAVIKQELDPLQHFDTLKKSAANLNTKRKVDIVNSIGPFLRLIHVVICHQDENRYRLYTLPITGK